MIGKSGSAGSSGSTPTPVKTKGKNFFSLKINYPLTGIITYFTKIVLSNVKLIYANYIMLYRKDRAGKSCQELEEDPC